MSDFTNGAHECFCDRKYKDANKLASCGDCPRDYIAGAWDARRKYIEHLKKTDHQRQRRTVMTDHCFQGANMTTAAPTEYTTTPLPGTPSAIAIPKPVGFWVLYPGVDHVMMLAVYKRPTDEQIKNTEALLGWGWKDAA